ncbi:hypothetical protein COCC4DRAFT_73881 [Bipolaris maydis ATCC 48331]|uniref:Uncharacterized protein n=2 Tax=Cochliobolus heterostrophus TaxID=5016 RepID=M2TK90_COCH5|nr:uncharacterized protein COCC4DRAFT_73881 [Bipolaris maydis ATCC 48331]EMD97880.1 hypothetical protein COCHEDRAFT_1200433 [Bipolaris maydis C5]KAJ5031940.1 hypothetical protein J3E73DRAFT_377890 [Bipolaris maydis]ENI02723.1 hypothetical protein COCC4DRAFT_73881 [Bipolaris maydis ATCC 48331]KAJ6273198.1 hypothetical protein PSV08DRAFT_399472 [Bipolaris maydis]KAJ6284407.1 hypothetical protein J3E71DRAFT_396871 [Bipolaris maydis]
MREFAREGIVTAQVNRTLEQNNNKLQQRVTDSKANIQKKRRDLKAVVCARENLVLALYEGLGIVPPDLKGNYDSREALNTANDRYISLLKRLIGYWKETCEAYEIRNSDVEHLEKHLRAALDRVCEQEKEIEELEERCQSVKKNFNEFVKMSTEKIESVNEVILSLQATLDELAGSEEEEETASQEAE